MVYPCNWLRIQYSGIQSKGLTDATGKFREGGIYKQNLYIEKFNSTNLHGDFLFNASNQFMGYKEDRFYQVVPFIGVGWAHVWKDGVQYTKDEITLIGGVINKFRINEALDFNVEIRGMLVNERFDGVVGDRFGENWNSYNCYYLQIPQTWFRSSSSSSSSRLYSLQQEDC